MGDRSFLGRLVSATWGKRVLFFVVCDVILIILSLFVSFLFHFDFSPDISYPSVIIEVLPFFVVTKLAAFALFRVYKITWRYVGLNDLANILLAVLFAELALIAMSLPNSVFPTIPMTGFPKRVLFVDGAVSLCLMGGLRISKRLVIEVVRERRPAKKGKATVIIGAGDTGEMILRDMIRNQYERFYPVGFLDDDPMKVGTYIHGVKVIGRLDDLGPTIAGQDVEAIVVAIPTLNHQRLRGIYESAKRLKVGSIKIVPRIYDFTKPDINLKNLEDISIEDLIGRQSVAVNYEIIKGLLAGKSVLVTGAGGSIGSEIVTQVAMFRPGRLILFDTDETELHNLDIRLRHTHPDLAPLLIPVVGDVRDEARVDEVMAEYNPQIVFHAAAYKHVPLMESNAREAVKVNIFGTYTLARASLKRGVDQFIMISTDKAVRPTSVMGATKRVAEYICRALNDEGQGATSSEIRNSKFEIRNPSVVQRTSGEVQSAEGEEASHAVVMNGYTMVMEGGKGGNEQRATSGEVQSDGEDEIRHAVVMDGHTMVMEGEKGSDELGATSEEIRNPKSEIRNSPRMQRGTRFVSVRFGNVLGSRGSVLPIFLEQLRRGGPLTVTDREMKRYFMTIPEAVSLVLQASTMGNGGEVFVLDMGEPVKILDLAEELIRIHGLEAYEDVDIEFTGLRPGEKLFEEILTSEEGTDASRHEKVFIARNSGAHTLPEIEAMLRDFREVVNIPGGAGTEAIRGLLRKYVIHYS